MKTRILTTLALWLTIAVTGAWADEVQILQNDNDSIEVPSGTVEEAVADEVQLRDGTTVTACRVPKRALSEDYVYTYKGVTYTYITENNYTKFFNLNSHKPADYGWYTNKDGWYVNAEGDYITAAKLDYESMPSNGEVYILNDLVGFFKDHTHLGCIADQACWGSSALRRVYFQDCAALTYTANTDFYFFIGDLAFANCPNLESVNMMQWTTSGTNHWEALPPTAAKNVWSSMLNDSPKAWIRVGISKYQEYLGSQTWVNLRECITTFEHSSDDITVNGAVYSFLKAEDGTALNNADDQHEEVMKNIRIWNADYQQFNAASLLSDKSRTESNANIWYTTVKGADSDYLKKNDGLLRIYNDPGSYYNYKTIAIRRGAFEGCDALQAVEFWQTNGRSENSYSDMKMVIENGAFKNCKNLKEIRLFYKVEDGTDHWQVLGPEDVIPGDNIFGLPTTDEINDMSSDELKNAWTIDRDFRILVSPDLYADFLNDPNWAGYAQYIKAADYMPSAKPDIVKNSLTYGYAANAAGIYGTDQVVSQEFSLWSIPVIVAEVAMVAYSAYNIVMAAKEAAAAKAAAEAAQEAVSEMSAMTKAAAYSQEALNQTGQVLSEISTGANPSDIGLHVYTMEVFTRSTSITQLGVDKVNPLFSKMLSVGLIDSEGKFMSNAHIIAAKALEENVSSELSMIFRRFLLTYQMRAPGIININCINLQKLAAEAVAKSTLASSVKQQLNATILGQVSLVSSNVGGNMVAQGVLGSLLNVSSLKQGMQANIMANMHQVSTHAMNMAIFTPHKNLIYHTFIKSAPDDIQDAVIYTGASSDTRTTTWLPTVFQNKKQLRTVRFHDNSGVSSHFTSANLIYIPDSAFVGCSALETLDLRLMTDNNGSRAMGPEDFVLCGDSIFAGLDSQKFHIIIPSERREDFEADAMWSQFKRFFRYEDVEEKAEFKEFGVKYAYTYTNGNQYVEKQGGHKIEHLHAIGADDDYVKSNNGALGFFNDIGSYNNYKLDYAKKSAFRGNSNIKSVSFWDVAGWLWTGDAYTDLQMTLQDSCFADCPNLEHVDMLYLRTDGSNIAEAMQPSVVQLGDGVFDGSPNVRFKMTDKQVDWFAADTTWAKYQDRFLPCLFLPGDPVVVSKLSDLKYRTDVARPWYDNNASKWGDWLDVTRASGNDYFNGKFSNNKDLRSFPDFKRFELIGLNQVGGSWFQNCENLSAIELPSTITHIGGWAFNGCYALKEITIPAAVKTIDESAFQYSGIRTVRCEGATPARLGSNAFNVSSSVKDFTIYVPAEAVEAYKTAWTAYAKYIKADGEEHATIEEVTLDQAGQLAEKLGLTAVMDGSAVRYLAGPYWKYKRLKVNGPMNGIDVGVLRIMMGADAWDSDPTDGQLSYVDLSGAQLLKDTEHSYNKYGVDEYLEKADWVGEYMFHNCTAIETVILPNSVTEIGENTFENAKNLKRIAIGTGLKRYTRDLLQNLTQGIEELVFLTDEFATSESDDPWEAPIAQVYTKKSQLGDYMGDPALTNRARSINALFEDDQVLADLTYGRCYFPSQYLSMESTKNPRGSYGSGNGYFFYRDTQLKTFDEFSLFSNIRELDYDFENCKALERITLPASIERIGYNAFTGCEKLATIHIDADSVPVLERGALRDLPGDFKVFVPKTHVKRYRERWAQYADHIVGEDEDYRNGIIEVTLTEPNTLAEKLGLKITTEEIENPKSALQVYKYVTSVSGNYSNIRALKVSGPISGADFTVMRFLAGYDVAKALRVIPTMDADRNYLGRLEYIDCYDADIVVTKYLTDGNWKFQIDKAMEDGEEDVLPSYAFAKSYSLKTLILPRSCKRVKTRAFQECEYLETLVVGDKTEDFNWNALDDCASMTRMYILAEKKMEMDQENWVWRNMCNNYSPTFDAFYVRPSLYQEYINDNMYVGSAQRTNNISVGCFTDDDSFAAFAAHAAATEDDLQQISDISGWFRGHEGVIDLGALQYTNIDSLRTADVQPLTQLRSVTLPASVKGVGRDAFNRAGGLRYVDMSRCADYAPTLAEEGGVRSLGITERTLAYMPAQYGESSDVNVAVGSTGTGFSTNVFRLYDGDDYCVPYAVKADYVENTRTLSKNETPYTVCLPYALNNSEGMKVYRLAGRGTNELIFSQTLSPLEPMQPYLVFAEENTMLNASGTVTLPSSDDATTVGGQQGALGYQLRGTLSGISNAEAVELGAYVLDDDGRWHPVLSDTDAHRAAYIPAFRCYLLQSRNRGTRAAIGMRLEDATGITQLRTVDQDGTERVYDLSGRRIGAGAKGIVIKNGQKIINK